ncbi:potassium channel family protein [Planctomycetota bacterium]
MTFTIGNKHLRKLVFVVVLLVAVVTFGTLGYWLFGKVNSLDWTLYNCLYMTFITLSSTGYTDTLDVEHLQSFPALLFTGFLMMLGLGMVVYCMSQLTALIVEGELQKYYMRKKMKKEIAELRDHFIVCGSGSTGRPIIEELVSTRRQVVAIDMDRERLEELHDKLNVLFVCGDSLDDETLVDASIEHASGLFAVMPEDTDNLFVTVTARGLNSRLRIVSKAIDSKMSAKLVRSGANAIVSPNNIGGMRMASEMVRPSVVKFLDRMLRGRVPHRIEEINIEAGSPLDGVPIHESNIQQEAGLLIVAVMYKDNDTIIYNPPSDTVINTNTILVTLGNPDQVKGINKLARSPKGKS